MKQFYADALRVQIYNTRKEMGAAAAADIKNCIRSLLSQKEQINMIFAAAPSQNEVLAALANDKEIPWHQINAYHMDEYIGLPADAPQGFGNFMRTHLFDLVPFSSVNCIDCTATDAEVECARYAKLSNRSAFAGSVALPDRLICVATKECNISMVDAVYMLTATPARILGLNKGRLETGMDADIVVYDDDINIEAVFTHGLRRL